MHGSSKWSLSLKFPHQNPERTSPLHMPCYMSRSSLSSRFDYPKILGEEYRLFSYSLKLLNVQFIFIIYKMKNVFDNFFRENSSATFRLVIFKFRQGLVGTERPFSRRVRAHGEKHPLVLSRLSFRV
jgi:hypothetical protein